MEDVAKVTAWRDFDPAMLNVPFVHPRFSARTHAARDTFATPSYERLAPTRAAPSCNWNGCRQIVRLGDKCRHRLMTQSSINEVTPIGVQI
jgi:hypothetical protein